MGDGVASLVAAQTEKSKAKGISEGKACTQDFKRNSDGMSRLLAAVSLLAGLRRSRDADPVAFADIICRVLDEDIAEVHAVS